jgi:O-acetyl-ADP-ribose deacetylase (regulator of RNase III)
MVQLMLQLQKQSSKETAPEVEKADSPPPKPLKPKPPKPPVAKSAKPQKPKKPTLILDEDLEVEECNDTGNKNMPTELVESVEGSALSDNTKKSHFEIVQNDITKLEVDVIVNAANPALQMGGGVCGAIFAAAGAKELQKECDTIGGCETGQAVITKGYRLPAKYIIHTPGPVWNSGRQGEEKLLRSCYLNSLALAQRHGCESIAFPLISSGKFGCPKGEALRVAIEVITEFLRENVLMVYLVLFE